MSCRLSFLFTLCVVLSLVIKRLSQGHRVFRVSDSSDTCIDRTAALSLRVASKIIPRLFISFLYGIWVSSKLKRYLSFTYPFLSTRDLDLVVKTCITAILSGQDVVHLKQHNQQQNMLGSPNLLPKKPYRRLPYLITVRKH